MAHDESDRHAGMKQLRKVAPMPIPMYTKVPFISVDMTAESSSVYPPLAESARRQERANGVRARVDSRACDCSGATAQAMPAAGHRGGENALLASISAIAA